MYMFLSLSLLYLWWWVAHIATMCVNSSGYIRVMSLSDWMNCTNNCVTSVHSITGWQSNVTLMLCWTTTFWNPIFFFVVITICPSSASCNIRHFTLFKFLRLEFYVYIFKVISYITNENWGRHFFLRKIFFFQNFRRDCDMKWDSLASHQFYISASPSLQSSESYNNPNHPNWGHSIQYRVQESYF